MLDSLPKRLRLPNELRSHPTRHPTSCTPASWRPPVEVIAETYTVGAFGTPWEAYECTPYPIDLSLAGALIGDEKPGLPLTYLMPNVIVAFASVFAPMTETQVDTREYAQSCVTGIYTIGSSHS